MISEWRRRRLPRRILDVAAEQVPQRLRERESLAEFHFDSMNLPEIAGQYEGVLRWIR